MRGVWKCQNANEQAHGETYAVQCCYSVELNPIAALRQFGKSKTDGERSRCVDPHLFPYYEP